jgi:general secretion pathway protein B
MSILLDAVTREKNQQLGTLPDAVLTPRANYPKPKSALTATKALWLVTGLVATVGTAWLLAQVVANSSHKLAANALVKTTSLAATQERQTQVGHQTQGEASELNPASPQDLTSVEQEQSKSKPSLNAMNKAQVQLAGKVALPVPRSYSATLLERNANEGATNEQDEQIDEALLASLSEAEKRYARAAFSEPQYDDNQQRRQWQDAQDFEDEPIMLGANANARGLAELAALKQQVNDAARQVNISDTFERYKDDTMNDDSSRPRRISGEERGSQDATQNADVGIHRHNSLSKSERDSQIAAVKQEAQKDNLLAAFEAALKDVEYEKSANQNVTPAALDPISQTQDKDYPAYGQLPAHLQLQVPEFSVVAHVYSSDANNRWLNVDGDELQEGGKIQDKLTLIEIRPRDIVLEIQGTKFKVPAI